MAPNYQGNGMNKLFDASKESLHIFGKTANVLLFLLFFLLKKKIQTPTIYTITLTIKLNAEWEN